MKLNSLIILKKGMKDADFYLTGTGNLSEIGEPSNSYHPENIGVTIAPGFLNRDYLFFVAKQLHAMGRFNSVVKRTSKGLVIEKKRLEVVLAVALKGYK